MLLKIHKFISKISSNIFLRLKDKLTSNMAMEAFYIKIPTDCLVHCLYCVLWHLQIFEIWNFLLLRCLCARREMVVVVQLEKIVSLDSASFWKRSPNLPLCVWSMSGNIDLGLKSEINTVPLNNNSCVLASWKHFLLWSILSLEWPLKCTQSYFINS